MRETKSNTFLLREKTTSDSVSKIDYSLQEIAVQITDPTTGGMEFENLALTAKNLDALARLMCSVKEGEAVVPVYLLAQLAVICHGYQRLVQELDELHGIETTTGSVNDIEADLRRFLTPEEQKRTDNPLLTQKREDPPRIRKIDKSPKEENREAVNIRAWVVVPLYPSSEE